MTDYDAYCMFSSMKMHFNNKEYDYFKYNGRLKITHALYENNPYKLLFNRLSKKPDPKNLILSNLLVNKKIWVTDCLSNEGETIRKNWDKINQSLTYNYKKDLLNLNDNFNDNFIIANDNQYPLIVNLLNHKKITLETFIILDKLVNFLPRINKLIKDTIIWPELYFKILKYSPFIQVDREIYRKVTVDTFS
jgi:hypothetical protein